MMKLYKITTLIILFFTVCSSFASTSKKHEKTKTINKEYTVNENATVFIDNKYGDINITTWDKNKVEITVKITVTGNDLDEVEDKLQTITVDFEGSKSLVEARTQIETTKSNWSWWGSNNKLNYKINYIIKMPITNNIDLNNKYGKIDINELEGKSNIKCSYGNIYIDELLNKTNNITLKYCGNSEIDFANSINIDADYSKIFINECTTVDASIDYTTLKASSIKKIDFNSDYGNVSIDNADVITGNSDYTSLKFGTINKNIIINTKYCGIRINNLAEGFEKTDINAKYSSIKIGTSSNNNFNFNIDLSYSGFNYPEEKVELNTNSDKGTKKSYSGFFGEENKNSTIKINSSYGGVSFKLID